jgi:hypothetical protein
MGSDKEFNLRGRSFTYFTNKRGSRIDPRGKRVSTHPIQRKKFKPCFYLLLDEQDLKQSSDTP